MASGPDVAGAATVRLHKSSRADAGSHQGVARAGDRGVPARQPAAHDQARAVLGAHLCRPDAGRLQPGELLGFRV